MKVQVNNYSIDIEFFKRLFGVTVSCYWIAYLKRSHKRLIEFDLLKVWYGEYNFNHRRILIVSLLGCTLTLKQFTRERAAWITGYEKQEALA